MMGRSVWCHVPRQVAFQAASRHARRMLSRRAPSLLLMACLALGAAPAHAATDTNCWVADETLRGNFQGTCVNGKAQGEGRAWQQGGAYYEGHFDQGLRSGTGVMVYANGDTYSGDWLNDRFDGTGRYAYGDFSPWRGDVYFGGWRNGLRHGKGTYVFWPSGERFAADWHDGATDTPAGPTMTRRKQASAKLAPLIGKHGAQVCSISTEGAGPDNMARGVVRDVNDDRLQVEIETEAVLAASKKPTLNPRWEILTDWMLCPGQ